MVPDVREIQGLKDWRICWSWAGEVAVGLTVIW